MQNITRGLFGNWTFDPEDDFVLPDGSDGPTGDFNNFEKVHKDFAMKCKAKYNFLDNPDYLMI